MDRSEDERRVVQRPEDQSETEGSRPEKRGQPERDKKREGKRIGELGTE